MTTDVSVPPKSIIGPCLVPLVQQSKTATAHGGTHEKMFHSVALKLNGAHRDVNY